MKTSRIIVWAVGCIAVLVILLLVFRVGMVVGYRQAQFSFALESHGRPGFLGQFADNNGFMNAHGATGTIVSVTPGTPATIVIYDTHDMTNKTVLVFATTTISGIRGTVPLSAITAGEHVVVIGAPNNQGQIGASIIRILPSQVASSSPSTSTI